MLDAETLDMLKEQTKVNDSNESKKSNNDEGVEKRSIDLSITKENGKLIHSSETIPLNSVLVNIIGATIGNCSKDGDEFKFNLTIEEDGSVNIQIHAPNNKINKNVISKLVDTVTDENKMNSELMYLIQIIGAKFRPSNGSTSTNGNNSNPRR